MPYGEVKLILREHEEIFAYTKEFEGVRWVVLLNFFGNEVECKIPEEVEVKEKKLILANYEVDETEEIRQFVLRPYEARVYQI